jgi:hypothetical protein
MEELSYVDLNKEAFEIVDEAARFNISILQKGQEQLNKYCDDLAGAITETTDTTMMNSLDGRLIVEKIGGVCVQESTTGAQLFDKVTINSGYTINANNGNLQVNEHFATSDFIKVDASTDYCVSQSNAVYFQFKVAFYDENMEFISMDNKNASSSTKEWTFITPENAAYIRIAYSIIVSGSAVDRGNIMLNKGTTSLSWESYTGGMASPNLDYPQEIKKTVVSGIKTWGKNHVYTVRTDDYTNNGITYKTVRDELGRILYIEANGTTTDSASTFVFTKKPFIVGKEYIISGCPEGGSDTTYSLNFAYAGSDTGEGFRWQYKGTEGQFRIMIYPGVTVNALRFYPMIRESTIEDGTYEPYFESAITLSQPIELNGNGDLQDVIEDGKIKRRFGKIIYNGSENWTREVTALGFVRFYRGILGSLNLSYRSEIFTTHFRYSKGGQTDGSGVYVFHQAKIHLYADFDTVEEFKAWLAANNVTVIYPLAEETIEELPLADQIALNSLQTFNGVTYVEFDCEVLPILKAKYGTTEVGRIAIESYCDSNLNSIGLQDLKAHEKEQEDNLAYKDISSILTNMSSQISGQACKENGMVSILITVPKDAVTGNFGGAFSIQISDSNYFPRLGVGGTHWGIRESDYASLDKATISSDGKLDIGFSAALNDTAYISFVYPIRRNE